MRAPAVLLVCGLFATQAPALAALAPQEVIAGIQVHGNTLTPTEEVVRASGLKVGAPFADSVLNDAEARLRQAFRLESVDILKRYASISDPTQILVLIHLDEGPVRVDVPDIAVPGAGVPPPVRPAAVRRSRLNVMLVPIIAAEDGYGLAYGIQLSFTGHRTATRRVLVPASWGGDKRLGVEFQQEFRHRFAPALRAGAVVQRRTHPFFDAHADRRRVWGRAEWPVLPFTRTAVEIARERTSLAGDRHDARSLGADLIVDTRVDPLLPHNALLVRAAAERLHLASNAIVRVSIDASAYVGLYRGMVLALRAVREDVSRPVPAFYESLLGGSRNLRGFPAGHRVGDTLTSGTAELRCPLTSPLRLARFGVSVFADIGTVYDEGQRLRDQRLERGYGAGIWMAAPVFGINLAVAHGVGARTRAHLSAGLTF